MFDPKSLVGLDKSDAIAKAQEAGFKTRIRAEDGVGKMGTADFRKDRVNFWIEQGKVAQASIG